MFGKRIYRENHARFINRESVIVKFREEVLGNWSRADSVNFVIIIILSFVAVSEWFKGNYILMFWDGWVPVNPPVDFFQRSFTVWEYWQGSGVYSPNGVSATLTLLPYYVLSFLFSVARSEQIIFFIEFASAGLTFYLFVSRLLPASKFKVECLVGSLFYMFNWYWIDSIFQDMIFPPVLSFLPLTFLLILLSVRRMEKDGKFLNIYTVLAPLSLILTSEFFYQGSVAILIVIALLILFLDLGKRNILVSAIKRFSLLLVFLLLVILDFMFILGDVLFNSNVLNLGASSQAPGGYLFALTHLNTIWYVFRGIAPSDFFVYPYTSRLNNFLLHEPIWFILTTFLIPVFSFLMLFFPSKDVRLSTKILFFFLAIFSIYSVMGVAGPLSGLYNFLLRLPEGGIFVNPLTTIGFIYPISLAVMLSISLNNLYAYGEKKGSRIRYKSKILKSVKMVKKYIPHIVVALLLISILSSSFPLLNGEAVPAFNAGHQFSGPTITAQVALPTGVLDTFIYLSNVINGQRTLILPSNNGINSETFEKGYISSTNLIQLYTGADIVAYNQYPLGNASQVFFQEVNELIWDNSHNNSSWYRYPNYFINTDAFGLILANYGIKYVLLVPNEPNLNYAPLVPVVSYNETKAFLNNQSDLKVVYDRFGFMLFRNLVYAPLISVETLSKTYWNTLPIVYNNISKIDLWGYSESGRNNTLIPSPYVRLSYTGNTEGYLLGPMDSMKVDVSGYPYLYLNVTMVNATFGGLIYTYEYGANYSNSNNWGTRLYPLYETSAQYGNIEKINVVYSTNIKYLPWLGSGNVKNFDYFFIGFIPKTVPGGNFSIRINDLAFSNEPSNMILNGLTSDYFTCSSLVYSSQNSSYSFKENSPTSFLVNVSGASGTRALILGSTYSPYWSASYQMDGKQVKLKPMEVNGFENGWILPKNFTGKIMVAFEPQEELSFLGVVSILSFASQVISILFFRRKDIATMLSDRR